MRSCIATKANLMPAKLPLGFRFSLVSQLPSTEV